MTTTETKSVRLLSNEVHIIRIDKKAYALATQGRASDSWQLIGSENGTVESYPTYLDAYVKKLEILGK